MTICWEAVKQRTVARSSTEAEYMALTEVLKEAINLWKFLEKIGVHLDEPTSMWNAVFHSRNKQQGQMMAYVLTKGLEGPKH